MRINGVVRIEPHRRDVYVRKMVRAKDILFFRIQLAPGFHGEGEEAQWKYDPRPNTVQHPHEPKLAFEKYRDEEKRKKKKEYEPENKETVVKINFAEHGFHQADGKIGSIHAKAVI